MKLWFYLYILVLFISRSSGTNSCKIKDLFHECVYTVVCENYAGSADNPSCDHEPYVTFIIKESYVESLTAGFFGSTNFDSRVRTIKAIGNSWTSIEEASIRYYAKTKAVDLSANNIKYVKSYAFKNLIKMEHLNLSHNAIPELFPNSFSVFENRIAELTILDLSYNKIQEISTDVFEYLANLEILHLDHNEIETLGDSVFNDQKNLSRLHLQNNKITYLNMSLINLKALVDLDVSYNHIKKISGYEINRLVSLEKINMSYNAIESIESNCFNQAFSLRVVDLSYNKIIQVLETVLFINNGKLQYLNLDHNFITKIEEKVFKHNVLYYLNLQNNNISMNISEFMFIGMKNIVEFDLFNQSIYGLQYHAFYDMIKLTKLNLSRNMIEYIDKSSFENLTELITLDLSDNFVSQVDFLKISLQNLTELSLNNNKLTVIKQGAFKNQKNLKKLDVSKNNILYIESLSLPLESLQYFDVTGNALSGIIKRNTFSPAKYLRYLDISNSNYSKIEKWAFKDMNVLSRLNISNNLIDFIDPDNFNSTNNMYSLDISHNNLTNFTIKGEIISNIKALYLNHNKLKEIPTATMPEILYLDLSHNLISNMTKSVLKSFNRLKNLLLSHNNITVFNNPYTNSLKDLTDLSLSSNSISFLNLSYFKEIVSLELNNNLINTVNSSFLQNMDKLQSLDISQNNISTIQPGTFQNLRVLKLLNVSSNNLSNLRYGSLKGLNRVEILDLSKNNIDTLDVDLFHECAEIRELIIDYNRIKELDVDRLVDITLKLQSFSLGGNPISCKEIVRNMNNINKTITRMVEVTSIDKIYHEDNVFGIKCGNTNYVTTEVPNVIPSTAESSHGHMLVIWCSLLSVFVLSGAGYVFYRRIKKANTSNYQTRLQITQSRCSGFSEVQSDLLDYS